MKLVIPLALSDSFKLRGRMGRKEYLLFLVAAPMTAMQALGMTPEDITALLFTLSIIAATFVAMIPFTHIAGQLLLPGQPGPNRYGAQPSKVLP